MENYILLQQYWWFLVSLLGALLVFLMFVQGGQSLLFSLGKDEAEKKLLTDITGSKWELTFTTLVTFGGAFFASFPLFYSTSFGGAYWVWITILLCFVVQAVSYEYQNKKGNLLGKRTYRIFLWINGVAGPLLIGTAVGTFFNGAEFIINKEQLTDLSMPVISSWANPLHGLEAVFVIWNLLLGLAVLFLSRSLAVLYFINRLKNDEWTGRCRKQLLRDAVCFLLSFLPFFIHLFVSEGYGYNPTTGIVHLEKYKYFTNLVEMPAVALILLIGVIALLYGIFRTLLDKKSYKYGIWFSGCGAVMAVLALLLMAGWNYTSYYPSLTDMQSSLTIMNSSSSEFTLKTMTYVSFVIPFVLLYIIYAWRSIDLGKDKKCN